MPAPVVYWDGAAVASALLRSPGSERALAVLREPAVHLLSTLAWTEAYAAAARLACARAITESELEAVCDALARGPWRLTYACPSRHVLGDLVYRPLDAGGAPLGAAGRWHLATAETLAQQLPELRVLSLGARLRGVAERRGLALD